MNKNKDALICYYENTLKKEKAEEKELMEILEEDWITNKELIKEDLYIIQRKISDLVKRLLILK